MQNGSAPLGLGGDRAARLQGKCPAATHKGPTTTRAWPPPTPVDDAGRGRELEAHFVYFACAGGGAGGSRARRDVFRHRAARPWLRTRGITAGSGGGRPAAVAGAPHVREKHPGSFRICSPAGRCAHGRVTRACMESATGHQQPRGRVAAADAAAAALLTLGHGFGPPPRTERGHPGLWGLRARGSPVPRLRCRSGYAGGSVTGRRRCRGGGAP